MSKNIIVELDEDGLIAAVHCPDETYIVDVLDHSYWVRLDVEEGDMAEYYEDLEKETENLKNCY